MTVLVAGGTGFVGRFIVDHLLEAGYEVAVGGRTPPAEGLFRAPVHFMPLTLDPRGPDPSALTGVSHLVHAAFDHVPGRYRGGEGDAPDRFRRINLDGSVALFKAARTSGARGCVFLSSRAVYGAQASGAVLSEETAPRPDTLYGEVKLATERALADLAAPGFSVASLRVTGVYGPAVRGERHKWHGLFEDFVAGRAIAPRCGTEVHGRDVGTAVEHMLRILSNERETVFNVSDMLVDRRDLLALFADEAGSGGELPDAADSAGFNPMTTARLEALGWHPGGASLFEDTVRQLARDFLSDGKSG